jgi:hypothetical protein
MMTRRHASAARWPALTAAALALPLAAVAAETFAVRLSPAPRDAAMRSVIAGHGAAEVTLDGATLTIAGTFAGFTTPATRAELRQGAVVATRGPAIRELALVTDGDGTSGSFSGTFTLRAAELAALGTGAVYVQIASESAPDGNVWGWLLPANVAIVRDR